MSQPHSETDPLLAFTIEPEATPVAAPPPSQPVEPVASQDVSAVTLINSATVDEVAQLRSRIDRVEKALLRGAKDLRSMKSEVATLVGVTGDIKKRLGRAAPASAAAAPRMQTLRIATAFCGVAIGVAIGVWYWMSRASEPVVPTAPVAVSEALPAATPEPTPPPVSALAQPAIVPAVAITPAATPVRDTRAPVASRSHLRETNDAVVTAYVGTLSIDADPGGDVFIDRKLVGKTPMRAENLKAGSHLVWIARDGYRRFTRVVQVPADRVTRLVADLEPAQR